jgi:peptide/nickel transport system substrate-binding protein
MASAYTNGDITFFQNISNASDYKRAKTAKNNVFRTAGGPNFRQMTLNGQSPVFKDVRVRQAFAEALDRTAIVKADVSGLPWPDTTLNNHYFMNNQTGYKNNSGAVGTFSDANASKLLDEAGWKMGSNGYRSKDGKTLSVNYVIASGLQEDVNEAQLVTQMEKAVGIKVNTVTAPVSDLFTKYVIPGNYDACMFSYYGTPFPISSNYSIYQEPKGSDTFQNMARIGSPALDDLMNQAMAATDPTQAINLANQIDAKLWQEVNVIPMYQDPQIYAEPKNLANFGAFGFADVIYQNIGYMKNAPSASSSS